MRALAIGGEIALLELVLQPRVGHREPAVLEPRERPGRGRHVPALQADILDLAGPEAVFRQELGEERDRAVGTGGQEDRGRPGRARRLGDLGHRVDDPGLRHFETGHPGLGGARCRGDGAQHRVAAEGFGRVLAVHHQDVAPALARGKAHQPAGRVLEAVAEHENIAAGDRGVVGERQHVQPPRRRARSRRVGCVDRTENDLGALGHRLVGRGDRLVGVAGGRVDLEVDGHALELRHCQPGGVFERLGQRVVGRVAAARRHQERHRHRFRGVDAGPAAADPGETAAAGRQPHQRKHREDCARELAGTAQKREHVRYPSSPIRPAGVAPGAANHKRLPSQVQP